MPGVGWKGCGEVLPGNFFFFFACVYVWAPVASRFQWHEMGVN